MKNIELLAPAGSWESLEATVKAGADAVYLAGQQFGARKSAQNFSETELIEAIYYCHLRGVKIYLTVNTLLSDGELAQLEAFLTPLYEAGLDAFIVQDLGVFAYLRKLYPLIDIHCSTQMALHTAEDIQAVKALGASRVVIPREMQLSEIKKVHDMVDIELEAFVHGALCVAVSGQCLMSSLIGGRSGNRGNCAQSCRQKYRLVKASTDEKVHSKDGDFLISPKELMTIDHIEEIVGSGVTSLKIEGRMKGPEYSFAVTRAYRMALDAVLQEASTIESTQLEASKEEIRRLFNRGFTTGFIIGTENKQYISQETPGNRGIQVAEVIAYDKRNAEMTLKLSETVHKGDDLQVRVKGNAVGGRVEYLKQNGVRVETADAGTVAIVNFKHEVHKGTEVYRTYDQQLMKQIQADIYDSERLMAVDLTLEMGVSQPLKLTLTHTQGLSVTVVSDVSAETALKTPLSDDRIREQLEKMGGTPFTVKHLEIQRVGDETIPIKVLNQLRRDGVEALIEALKASWQRRFEPNHSAEEEDDELTAADHATEALALTAMVRTPVQYMAAASLGVKTIYVYNLFESAEAQTAEDQSAWLASWLECYEAYPEVELIPYLGRFVYSELLAARLNCLKEKMPMVKTILAASLGQMELAQNVGYQVFADFSLNAFNRATAQFLVDRGAAQTTLSLELNESQIETMLMPDGTQRHFEIIGYGKIPVMVNAYCPINGVYSKDKPGCQICRKDQFYLEDKTGARFQVKGDARCQVEIFNSAILNLADEWHVLSRLGISKYRLNFVDETREEVCEVIETHIKSSLDFPIELRGKGYTKGHFKRGVL